MSADLAAALANVDLGEFEGAPVLGTAIDIPNAGGGLHEAMKIQPTVLRKGDRIKVLLDCEVVTIGFPPVKDTQGVTRTHRLKATGATIVDGQVFEDALAAQADQIQRARDAASGQTRLDDAQALLDEHAGGLHKDLVDECPSCIEEQEAEAAGD